MGEKVLDKKKLLSWFDNEGKDWFKRLEIVSDDQEAQILTFAYTSISDKIKKGHFDKRQVPVVSVEWLKRYCEERGDFVDMYEVERTIEVDDLLEAVCLQVKKVKKNE